MKRTLTLALAAALLCSTAALAGSFKRTAALTPPDLADSGDAELAASDFGGVAVVESGLSSRAGSETFSVRVWANVKDGVSYFVEIVCDKGTIKMGTLTMHLGSDALKVTGPPVPVATIQKVQIRNKRGAVVLSGSFPRVTTGR